MYKLAATRPKPAKGELTALSEAQLDAVSGGVGPVKLNEIKWVLPPERSDFYISEKAHAHNAGYNTVEYDDITYSPGGSAQV